MSILTGYFIPTVGDQSAGDAVVGLLVPGWPQLLALCRGPGRRVAVEGEGEGVTRGGEPEEVALGQLLQRVLAARGS